MPMTPRMAPKVTPAASSRRMTRHQSRSRISPNAIARMTRVVACEPEFPPLLMISGMKRASTTARSISAEKKPMAVAVNISPTKRMASHPARLRTICPNVTSRYGPSSASIPPIFSDIFSGLLLNQSGNVSAGDDTQHVSFLIQNGYRQQTVLCQQLCDSFLVSIFHEHERSRYASPHELFRDLSAERSSRNETTPNRCCDSSSAYA